MLSNKQKTIAEFCLSNGTITTQDAVDLIGSSYYTNKRKHTGDVLSRMVKRGFLERVKNGVFKLKSLQHEKDQINNPAQLSLL